MKSAKPLVSVIIPTYMRIEKLVRCISSVKSNTYRNLEIIVVNDDPSYNMRQKLGKLGVRVIQNSRRRYAAYSRNRAAKAAKGEILFFVDDDNILDKNAIAALVAKYITLDGVGLLGPIMYDAAGKLWFYGAKINWISPYAVPVEKPARGNMLIRTEVIPNAYMVSRRAYVKVGMENWKLFKFHHHEELDMAQRLKAQGYQNFIYTGAKTIHDYEGLQQYFNPLRLRYIVRNNMIIEKLYAPKARLALFLLTFVPVHMAKYLAFYIPLLGKEKLSLYRAYFTGLSEGINFLVKRP